MHFTRPLSLVLAVGMLAIVPGRLAAQEDAGRSPTDTMEKEDSVYGNAHNGEFSPAKGFELFKNDRVSFNISFYGLFRYLNQMSAGQTFVDHLGRTRTVNARNDLNWHRTMVWLTGFFFTQRFRYNITLWSLPTTQQTLLFGNLQYRWNRFANFGVGIAPNLTARSMQGSWPFWGGSDRQMSEDYFRGGFSSGFFITGQPLPRFFYTASVNTNLSQLGVVAANDSRDMAYSASVYWAPTTGEFGPRGGFGDLEYHTKVATRFGMSAAHSRESRYSADTLAPNATQIRLSDGVFPFETGALAPGVVVQKLDYDEMAFDAGLKYRGWTFQGEYYLRRLSNFQATGPVPITSNFDKGFQVQGNYMVVPKYLAAYVTYGKVYDDFKRYPWELSGGTSFYPTGTRSWRLNLHVIKVEKSPAGSNFGYYTAGQSGTTISIGTDILL